MTHLLREARLETPRLRDHYEDVATSWRPSRSRHRAVHRNRVVVAGSFR
jgi:hypothetical protein